MPLIAQQDQQAQASKPGLRERNKQTTRLKILRAAMLLFERSGVAATSIDEIAELAEVSDTTVYNYFRTKDELIDAFLQEATGAHSIGAQLAQRPATESPFIAMRNLIRETPASNEDLHARRQLVDRVRGDKLLWGAYLRANEQFAGELAMAFQERAPEWGREKALTAAHAAMGALGALLDLQTDASTAESWRAESLDVVSRLHRGWRH